MRDEQGADGADDNQYRATPIAESWGDSGWKAGVLLSGGDARGDRPAKSLSSQLFESREAALDFAQSEYGALGR